MTSKTKVISDHAFFIRATLASGSFVYYPEEIWPTEKSKVEHIDSTRLGGYGVYDTRVSTLFAVELYPTLDDAEAHRLSTADGEDLKDEVDHSKEVDSATLKDDNNEAPDNPATTEADVAAAAAPKGGIKPRNKAD